MTVYGYTAWLLLPIIIHLFAKAAPSPASDYLLVVENLGSTLLGLWVTAAIMLYVAVARTHSTEANIDFNALGKLAWEKVLTLFVIQVFTVCLVIFGTILFVIPGIIAWVWTVFAVEEGILTNRSIGQALRESRELTRGRFLPIFGRLLAANIFFVLVILALFIAYLLAGLHGSAGSIIPTLIAWPDWLQVGLSLITLPLTPIAIVFHLLLYFAAKKSYSAANV